MTGVTRGGSPEAPTGGLLPVRPLFRMTGTPVTNGAVGSGAFIATRKLGQQRSNNALLRYGYFRSAKRSRQ